MKWQIKRIPIWPVAKISFIVYAVVSLIGMLFFNLMFQSMLGMIPDMLGQGLDMGELGMGAGMGFMMAIFMAIPSAIFYTLITIIAVVLYNAIASLTGGVEMEIEQAEISALDILKKRFDKFEKDSQAREIVETEVVETAPIETQTLEADKKDDYSDYKPKD